MKIKKHTALKTLCYTFLLGIAGILSACTTTQDFSFGAAGLDNSTPTSTMSPDPISDATELPIAETFGHIIFVSNRDGLMSLYKTTPDGIEQTRLTNAGAGDSKPHVSPDGSQVAFVSTVNDNMDIYVLDLTSLNITRVTDAPEKDSSPSWSPDGKQIAFESFRDGNFEIYLANSDGSNQIRLTNDLAGDSDPVWSPVTNEIAFVSNRFGNADILLVNPNGSISTLTTNSAPDSAPDWSPDGSMIAFKTYSGDLANLCLIGRDGLNQRCLTAFPLEYGSPVWSPDGSKFAVSAKQANGYGIDIFNPANGTTIELSSPGIEPHGTPAWSPEGLRLVIQAQFEGDMELFVITIPTNEFSRLTSIASYDGEPIWSQK